MTYREYAKQIEVHPTTVYRWMAKSNTALNVDIAFSVWEEMRATFQQKTGRRWEKIKTPEDASLDKELKDEKRRSRKLEVELGDRKRLEGAILERIPHLVQPSILYVPREKRGKSQATPVICLNDQHAGNAASPIGLIEKRMGYLRQKFGEWIEGQRATYTLEDVHVFGLGDYIEGALRESAKQTITEQEPEQAVEMGNLIAQFCLDLTSQFRKVHLSLVMVDNHARIDQKMNFEQAVSRSWNIVVEAIIRGRLGGHKDVTLYAPHDFFCWVKVENTRFLNIHGNGIRMMRRTPYYGIDDRLALEKSNRQGTPTEFDYMNLAHFHHGAEGSGWGLRPPMVGTTGYDRGCGRETHPAQDAFLVSPKYKNPFCKVTFDLEGIT